MSLEPASLDERREDLVRRIDAQQKELGRVMGELGTAVRGYAHPGALVSRAPYTVLAVGFAFGLLRGLRRHDHGDGWLDG
ncbi:MAG: hypothetical protein IPK07_11885 [Deltaproteobacteria bacterium]|nr:hypothetical protein [Deltaproteobacteria bacterium]